MIDAAVAVLSAEYILPDTAARMIDAIRARRLRGEYDAVSDAVILADVLTAHLREVSRDQHLRIDVRPIDDDRPGIVAPFTPPANLGFERVERLDGNIGWLDLRLFMELEVIRDRAIDAMRFLASCDAAIFDLRDNLGGAPATVAFLISYLFTTPVHLSDFYSRANDATTQSWTLASIPNERLTSKRVYVLTSGRTFSGGEEFAYNLKHLKRATLVGETTAGAAHLIEKRRLDDRFVIRVPNGRPINPITKTSWEGVGVEPDVHVPATDALRVAHELAIATHQPA